MGEYFIDVKFGTPPQNLTVMLDSTTCVFFCDFVKKTDKTPWVGISECKICFKKFIEYSSMTYMNYFKPAETEVFL